MSTGVENGEKLEETGVNIRTSVRGTVLKDKLKSFVFIVRSLCPESTQPMELREHDRIFSPASDVTAPKKSIRIRSRLQQCAPPTSMAQPQVQPQPQPQAQSQAQPQSKPPVKNPTSNSSVSNGQNNGNVNNSNTSGNNVNRTPVSMPVGPAVLTFTNIKDRRVAPPYERRAVTTVTASSSREAEALLTYVGCTFEYEYVRKGMRHFTRTGLVVDVFAVEKLNKPGDPNSTSPITADGHTIVFEVWSDSVSSPEPLITFLQLLSPYVSIPSSST